MIKRIGFTLIELIVVILILGILAAVAVPRFINLKSQANVAALMGLRAAVNSALDLSHGLVLAAGIPVVGNGYITIEGVQVVTWQGYASPQPGGIDRAVQFDSSTFVMVGWNPVYFQVTGAPDPTHCQISYRLNPPATYIPVITTLTDGC